MTLERTVKRRLNYLLSAERKHENSSSYHIKINFPEKHDENALKSILTQSAEENGLSVSYLSSHKAKSTSGMVLSKNKSALDKIFTYSWLGSRWLMISYSFPVSKDISEISFEIDRHELYKKEISSFMASVYRRTFSDSGENLESFLKGY